MKLILPKLHHKLQYMNHYLHNDFKMAQQAVSDPKDILGLVAATMGVTIHSQDKARGVYPLLKKVEGFYLKKPESDYPLKTAIFVSKHKVLDSADYKALSSSLTEDDLSADQKAAKKFLPFKKPSIWSQLF